MTSVAVAPQGTDRCWIGCERDRRVGQMPDRIANRRQGSIKQHGASQEHISGGVMLPASDRVGADATDAGDEHRLEV